VENHLAELVDEARHTTDGHVGSALVLVLHRLRQRRPEDARARAELHRLFQDQELSVAVGPRVAA
jgi:hypothetical protein